MTTPKTPAFYLRVSTDAQDYPSQMHAIREFCRRKEWPVPSGKNIFSEKVSGSKASRRELDRILQACRHGEFDSIVTFRGDRLGRSLRHMANIYAELKAIGIRVVGVADGIDTADDTPGSNAFRNMLATFSELTRETIVENTKAGQAAARARGAMIGRPRKNEKKIAQVFRLNAKGCTRSEIHRRTGLSIGYVSDLVTGKIKLPNSNETPAVHSSLSGRVGDRRKFNGSKNGERGR